MLFYAKSVSFWPNEWIFKYSDKIMSCKLWSKVMSVFLNINFCAKMSILRNKKWISWEMLIISNKCAILLKVNILLETMLISRKLWLFLWFFSKNCSISQKIYATWNVNFTRKMTLFSKISPNKIIFWIKITIFQQN